MRFVFLPVFYFLAFTGLAQKKMNIDSLYMREHYEKTEYNIRMRDGVQLFTIVYTPKDKSQRYPILLNRTCYNASTYGDYNTHDHPSKYLVRDK